MKFDVWYYVPIIDFWASIVFLKKINSNVYIRGQFSGHIGLA